MNEKRAGRYLLYALGEILLIVVGILIALQLGNLDQKNKAAFQEKRILLDLRNEIDVNLNRLISIISEKKQILSTCKLFLNNTGENPNWETKQSFDSLLVITIVSGWKFYPETGVLTDVLNSGKLDLITNDSLRHKIASLPGFTNRVQYEDDIVRDDLHNMYLPFLSKNYPVRNTNNYRSGSLTKEQRKVYDGLKKSEFPSSPELLLGNPEFENLINMQMMWVNFSLFHYREQQRQYGDVLQMIKEELQQSK